MATCTVENWTLQDLAAALQNMHKDNKKISVPMFQRGKRWTKSQQTEFIDSLIKGYPVGTMLFYETVENGQSTYILVDGLQRGDSIKKYMANPTEFFYDSSISEEFCVRVLENLHVDNSEENHSNVRTVLTSFIRKQKAYKNLQYFGPAKELVDCFDADFSCIETLIEIIGVFFKERQDLYEQIALTVIPVIVYHGAEENLPEIFDRINSQGTPLDQYEVYAAAWPTNKRFYVSNAQIIEAAIKKYDAFVEDGFSIHDYDREKMRSSKKLNAFEYLFGLSKVLVNKYDFLGYNLNFKDDTVNPIGFELVNACLNDSDKIKTLYENIYSIKDIGSFENALYSAIEFVENSVSAVMRFKGNSHSEGLKLFHSKYQILSMISTTFKEMYNINDYSKISDGWSDKKEILQKNLKNYYVYDILTNYWSDGGTTKIHSAAKPNRYIQDIAPRTWKTALDGFFEKSMQRQETKQVANPRSEEYVFLNCIYLNTFTAMDQLSLSRFDIEHIATKEQMRKLITKCKGSGLPISCVANLCYLPEYVNRSKKDRNFYQDDKYLQKVDLSTVEQKYSFTTRDDLEWMDMPFETPSDFNELKQFYNEFCTSRYEELKKRFCAAMAINYEGLSRSTADSYTSVKKDDEKKTSASQTLAFASECIKKVEEYFHQPLEKINRSVYKTVDGKKGFVICLSKAYMQGEREKYWYAYRKASIELIKDCEEQYIVYGCKDASEVLLIPNVYIGGVINRLNYSSEDGEVSHWHVVIFIDSNGHVSQLLSKPEIEEVSLDCYRI